MRHLWTVLVALLLIGLSAAAQEVNYQGELRDGGVPFDGTAAMKFVIVDDDTGLTIWSHDGSVDPGDPPVEPGGSVMVPVGDGLFSVMLGLESASMAQITGADALNLGRSSLRMWVNTGSGFERLSDQMLASSPSSLSVRQVDPDATDALARWDGFRLSRSPVFAVGDRVGVGTRTPEYALDVEGGVRSRSIGFVFPDGTVQATAQVAGPPGPIGPAGSSGPAGPPGPAVTTFCVESATGVPIGSTVFAACGSVCGSTGRVRAAESAPCRVTSDTGSCDRSSSGKCCVCVP